MKPRCQADILDGTSTTLAVGERPPSADLTLGWWYAGWGQLKNGSTDSLLGVREVNLAPRFRDVCPRGSYHFHAPPHEDPCHVFHFWSRHPGGGHFLFADGSARFLSDSADARLPALASRNGGEVVGDL